MRRRLHAKLRRVREEALRWTALLESKVVPGTHIYDHQPIYPNFATLTGSRSRFNIKAKCVSSFFSQNVFSLAFSILFFVIFSVYSKYIRMEHVTTIMGQVTNMATEAKLSIYLGSICQVRNQ